MKNVFMRITMWLAIAAVVILVALNYQLAQAEGMKVHSSTTGVVVNGQCKEVMEYTFHCSANVSIPPKAETIDTEFLSTYGDLTVGERVIVIYDGEDMGYTVFRDKEVP